MKTIQTVEARLQRMLQSLPLSSYDRETLNRALRCCELLRGYEIRFGNDIEDDNAIGGAEAVDFIGEMVRQARPHLEDKQ